MTCDEDVVIEEFTGPRGDTWWQEWAAGADELADWDETTLLVQIRAGSTETAELLASSEPADVEGDVVAIDITASNFASDLFGWKIDADDTDGTQWVAGDEFWIEAQCEIDGRVTTFMRHRWYVSAQVAVVGSGS